MVTATLGPFHGLSSHIDVTVSSLGDASSLSGGVLLQTPLLDPLSDAVYVVAQGPVSTGTLLAAAAGSGERTGPTNTGRVPGGGLVTQSAPLDLSGPTAGLVLRNPDFTNAARIAEAVNDRYPGAAQALHAGLVRVQVPPEGVAGLMAALEADEVDVDVPARVVINERTGAVVAGGQVRIAEVMITYGGLVISTQIDPVISQPAPFSDGETVVTEVGAAQIDQETAQSIVLPPNTDVTGLASALNALGLSSRDVIAVFQAIDRAGALQGELVIL
jgi:flagellar P-ring protein precursor FlgI